MRLDESGLPLNWQTEGATTFGNPVDEVFRLENGTAFWRDTTGENEAVSNGPAFYMPQKLQPLHLRDCGAGASGPARSYA